MPVTTWSFKDTVVERDIIARIGSDFYVDFDPATTLDIRFFDDFDAHLWNADLLLCQINKQRFQLINRSGCIGEVRAPGNVRFWWEFPDSKVKSELKRRIDLRAVLPVASLHLIETNFSLRNSDQKIVVKGRISQSVGDGRSNQYLTLQSMRGYDKCFSRAEKLFEPLFKAQVHEFGLKTMFAEQDFQAAGQHSSQPPHLAEEMPTELAVRAMANEMLAQATRHVNGLVADTDTEFLHQFRVNVRKLRSLISLLKKSLPTSTVDVVAEKLSAIAGRTNRLRDLDVFLLAKDSYRAMLPASHKKGLSELYALIEKQRQQEKSLVSRYFSSRAFLQDIAACAAEVSAAAAFQTTMARKPVLSVAKSLLVKRNHKILTMSALINAQSADEDVHQIRIEFKKLRYLIEFFIDLLPKKRIAGLLAQLKKIQSVLGDFNDYCVQVEFLSGYIDDHQIEMTKALSGLIAILHHKQVETRKQVEAAIALFFTEDMAMKFDLAFGAKANGDLE